MTQVTLTFDNGPTLDTTPKVLEILAQHGVQTTFFVIGQKMAVPAARSVAERAAAEGHWIGNHTYTHSRSLGQFEDAEEAIGEITRADEVIGSLGHQPRLFRPCANGGTLDRRVFNPQVVEHLRAGGYTVPLWNVLPRDWEGGPWVERALEQLDEHEWSSMVVHDVERGAIPGLEEFLRLALAAGVTFRQDFAPDCVVIANGEILQRIDHLVAGTAEP
jgi:peptidoglycan-N-acetylglucosamine deacetylase